MYPFKRRLAVSAPLTLNQANIYVLPNRWGGFFAGLAGVLLLVALNYGNNLALLLTVWLAALGLISAVHGQRNLHGLNLSPRLPDSAFAGEAIDLTWRIENPAGRMRYAVRLGAAGVEVNLPRVETEAVVHLSLPPAARGWYTPLICWIETAYPLGLFRVWGRCQAAGRCLIYPAPARTDVTLPMQAPNAATHDELSGFRPYQAGDALRQVHWKAYAAGRGLHTRLYSGSEAPEHVVTLDWAHTSGLDTEARLSQLCRWVLDADAAGLTYSLTLPGRHIAAAGGAAQRLICLEALALFQTPV